MRTGDLLVVALAALSVSACSHHAGTLPTTSPSASVPRSSAPPSSPADPAAELRDAIARYYAALNAAVRDPAGKTDALASLIAPSCECRQVVDVLRSEARQRHYLDYSYTTHNIRVISVGSLGGNATYVVVQSPGHERSSDGTILHSYPGSTEKFSAHFRREGSTWLLDRASRT